MKTRIVNVNSIYLDVVNPRFDAVNNQDEAIAELFEKCGSKNSETIFSITELHNLVHGTMHVPACDAILTYAPRVVPFIIALNGGEPPQEI